MMNAQYFLTYMHGCPAVVARARKKRQSQTSTISAHGNYELVKPVKYDARDLLFIIIRLNRTAPVQARCRTISVVVSKRRVFFLVSLHDKNAVGRDESSRKKNKRRRRHAFRVRIRSYGVPTRTIARARQENRKPIFFNANGIV